MTLVWRLDEKRKKTVGELGSYIMDIVELPSICRHSLVLCSPRSHFLLPTGFKRVMAAGRELIFRPKMIIMIMMIIYPDISGSEA